MTDQLDLDGLEGRYLLVKRGLYYRPNAMGYTGIRDHAGRYTEAEALDHADDASGVTAVREDEAPLIAPNCFDDIARDYLITRLRASEAATAAARQGAVDEIADGIEHLSLTPAKRELVKAAFRACVQRMNRAALPTPSSEGE